MPLPPSSRLGSYEIVGPLGTGGMGEVYRARDLRLGRDIALKVLPAARARDADHLARFEREARTVAGLNHPNIVTLHSVEDADGVRFLTMELIEGRSLADLVEPGGLLLDRGRVGSSRSSAPPRWRSTRGAWARLPLGQIPLGLILSSKRRCS